MSDIKRYLNQEIAPNFIALEVSNWFKEQEYDIQILNASNGGSIVQVRKSGLLRTALGISSALSVAITKEGKDIVVETGASEWKKQVSGGAIGSALFFPALATTAYGAWKQSKLPDQVFKVIENYIETASRAPGLSMENQPNEPILFTAHGVNKNVELTDSFVKIITFKKEKIIDIKEIPRNAITNVCIKSGIMYSRYMDILHGKSKESIPIIQLEEFESLFEKLDETEFSFYMRVKNGKLEEKAKHEMPWYLDNSKLNHIATYSSAEEATRDSDHAALAGWMPSGTSATDGHINIGRTASEAVLTGGLTLLLGASRTKGKITVTYIRTPRWLDEHNMGTKKDETAQAIGSNDAITQLERLARLKQQGILTDEEFQAQKNKLLR